MAETLSCGMSAAHNLNTDGNKTSEDLGMYHIKKNNFLSWNLFLMINSILRGSIIFGVADEATPFFMA